MDNNKCQKGHHYHPTHPKADANGCMKDDDMKEGTRESYKGTISIYNAVRGSGQLRSNDPKSYIGV